MAGGDYQRTCNKCHATWIVPAALAEERPTPQTLASQFASTIGANYDDQLALRAHYQQLAAAAKCPQCGATSFTQEQGAFTAEQPAPPAAAAAPGQARTFVLNQKLISFTGDMWIEDGQGNHAFEVDGKMLSLHGMHVLKDLNGQTLYEISKPLAPHVHRTIEVKRDGKVAATVQEAIFHLGGDKFKITLAGGRELGMHGNWSNRIFAVKDQAGQVVIDASRLWFTIHGAYGIQIAPGFDVALGLGIVIALERVEAEQHGEESPVQSLIGDINPF